MLRTSILLLVYLVTTNAEQNWLSRQYKSSGNDSFKISFKPILPKTRNFACWGHFHTKHHVCTCGRDLNVDIILLWQAEKEINWKELVNPYGPFHCIKKVIIAKYLNNCQEIWAIYRQVWKSWTAALWLQLCHTRGGPLREWPAHQRWLESRKQRSYSREFCLRTGTSETRAGLTQ